MPRFVRRRRGRFRFLVSADRFDPFTIVSTTTRAKKPDRHELAEAPSPAGIQFCPTGPVPDEGGVLIHEVGYLENKGGNVKGSAASLWRLYYHFDHGQEIRVGNRSLALGPDQLVLVPGGVESSEVESHTPVRKFWLNFSLGMQLKKPGAILLPMHAGERSLLDRIVQRFEEISGGDRFRIFHEASALLHLVITRPELEWQPVRHSSAALKAAAYVAKHFAHSIDVATLAKEVGVSPRVLTASFRREYHVAPSRFIAKVRVREAAKLLVTTELSIDAIAARTGFPDRYYLTRVFGQITGKPPARYRREYRMQGV